MKPDIHPQQNKVLAQCVCANEFYFYSALDAKVIHVEVCNKCHPFYTGKQQIVSTTGRVDNFNSRFSKFKDAKAKMPVSSKSEKPTRIKKINKDKGEKSSSK